MTSSGFLDSDHRLATLDRYDVLDTPREEAFDRITRLVCRLFGVPMSTVTFIDGHRQWFKSCQGVAASETERDIALCRVPVVEDAPLVVPDTLQDPRFRDSPLVVGGPRLRFYAGVPFRGADGIVVGTLCAMDVVPHAFSTAELDLLCDLAKMVETELQLRIQANTDALTQALSRRAFHQEAERAIALAVRHRYDLACISFDIDRFKTVNDENGHAAGDLVLKQTVEASRAQLRKSDIFGRLGGEEFAILLPHTAPSDGVRVAEKLRVAVAGQSIALPDRMLQVTASYGVTSLEPTCADVSLLLERADKAMYQAKTRGRNCSVVWADERPEMATLSRRVLKAGKIVFNRGNSVIDCSVKRLSDMGARLDVVAADNVPRRFKLSIAADALSRACTVTGQSGRSLEVVFE